MRTRGACAGRRGTPGEPVGKGRVAAPGGAGRRGEGPPATLPAGSPHRLPITRLISFAAIALFTAGQIGSPHE